MSNQTRIAAEPGSQAIDIVRRFDAPAALVYRAYADPDLLARWMGPRGMGMRVEAWELQHGGRYRFVNTDAQGTEYGFRGVFHGTPSVDEGILWTFEFEGAPGHVALEKVTFAEADGVTTMTVRSVHASVEARDAMISSGMEHGVVEGYEKLDELLASLPAAV